MQQSIIQTKVVIPRRRPDLLSRPRLLDLLHDLVDYRLILAVAPAGYGKTSLFIDFAHQADIKVCWYSVDESDFDFPRFFTYFVSAIIRRFPDLADSVLARPEMLLLNRLTSKQLVTVLVNEIYEKIHEHFMVVVDDYHLVHGQVEIEEFLSQFVQLSGDHCHLALLSRTLLSLPDLPLMIARSYVGGLSFEELRFQKDEIQDLLHQKYGVSLSEDELTRLLQTTEGWITGLLLSSLRNNSEITNWARLSRVSGIDLYDYLAQQVLNRQSETIRHFLLRTSLLEEFNASLCESILGAPPPGQSWQGMLDTIFHDNLFVLGVGEAGTWMRYHHLFQQFLQKIIEREAPEEAQVIQHRLADYYAQSNNWERAYLIYQNLGDIEALTSLIKNAGTPLLKSGRYYVLSKWLDSLPLEIRQSDPLLVSLYGIVSVNIGQVEDGLRYLSEAVTTLEAADNSLALAQTLVRRALTYYQTGSYQLAVNDADQALLLIKRIEDVDSPISTIVNGVQAEARRIQGLCDYVIGNYTSSIYHLELARQTYIRSKDLQNDTTITLEIGIAHAGTGHYQKALTFFEQVLENWRNLHNILGQANVLNNLGVLYQLQGNYPAALQRLIEAMEYCRRSGFTRMEAYTLASIGDLFADLKVPAIATEFYERAYPLARSINERFLLLHLNLALLLLALPKDRQQDAKIFLDAASRLVSEETSPFEHGLFRMVVGQYHLLGGRKCDAIDPLQEAVASLAKTDQRVEFAKAHLFLGAAHHDCGNRSSASEAVAQGIRIAAELENWHPLVTAGHNIRSILESVEIEEECKTGLARLLDQVRVFNQNSPELRHQLRQQIEPFLSSSVAKRPQLQIRTFGRGEVIFNGKVVENSEWQTQSARDLFFCFIAHEEGLTKEEVGEIFWSDSTPGQLKTRFKNAIYRLRSALDQEAVIFENDLYYFNRTLDYEYDVEIFERAVAAARAVTSVEEKRTALLRVSELYQGDYLPELDPAWAQLERERLRRLHVDAMLELADIYLQTDDPTNALIRCQTLLADDPCLENAHRLAMRAHAQRGNRADIARQYELCYTALLDEFGIPPSPETEKLYDQLMA
ncbi:MAG: tetratricopeptide repeat protein [Caldilineaceae bacterium]|nr:tetratricopeptide repeat protein [Caldilineaceae bacterium]